MQEVVLKSKPEIMKVLLDDVDSGSIIITLIDNYVHILKRINTGLPSRFAFISIYPSNAEEHFSTPIKDRPIDAYNACIESAIRDAYHVYSFRTEQELADFIKGNYGSY